MGSLLRAILHDHDLSSAGTGIRLKPEQHFKFV
jgi:hypothetical protein